MSKVRNIRKRRAVDEEDEGDGAGPEQAQAITAEEIKLLQKQRQLKKVRRL